MNENQEKAAYFAQYYGQPVFKWEGWAKEAKPTDVFPKNFDGWYVEARSLSSLTDEEAVEVANVVYPGFNKTNEEKAELGHAMAFGLLA